MNALKPGSILKGEHIYRIERVLGAGGFGITYLASFSVEVGNLTIPGYVAIKEFFPKAHCQRHDDGCTMYCPGTEDSRTLVAASLKDFLAEARRLSQYSAGHSNIVKVNEILEANGTAYYVMEFLEGENLGVYIHNNGALTEPQIKELVYPVIDAVAYLHSQRVTHLDIKPGNIMLAQNKDGSVRPVLIDFGLSKHYNEDGSATSTVNTMACSDGYAPMEQYMGIRTFAPAADVYALGASLYEAATGKRPTSANSWPSGEPAATIASLQLSPELKRVITRAMSKLPEDRYPDAGAMLADLGIKSAASTGTPTVRIEEKKPKPAPAPAPAPIPTPEPAPAPISTPVKPQRSLTRVGLIAACAVILLLAAWGGYKMINKPEPVDPALIAVVDEREDSIPQEIEQPEELPVVPAPEPDPEPVVQDNLQAEAERIRQEAAERERLRQEAEERQRQEAAARQNREEINGLIVNWGSGVTAAQKEVLRRLVGNMVYVSGGTFTMGASVGDSEAYNWEKPAHQVTLSSYRIGRYEVTQKEWETVMGNNPSYFRGDNLPVENVSWTDCQEFISRLNNMTGLRFHLPTEAQWEYAARGGNRSNGYKYSGSNNIGSVAWNEGNSGNRTHPAGQKSANELGICDMSGNVWEWCQDWYGDYSSGSVSNPSGPSSGSYRVIRGGSWDDIARNCRVSFRNYFSPSIRDYNLGLRVAY